MSAAASGGVLLLNAGSSSFKWSLLDAASEAVLASGHEEWRDGPAPVTAMRSGLAAQPQPLSVGHRLVHGGHRFTGPVRIDSEVRAALADLVPLDPLHAPRALELVDAARETYSGVPHVACFDTTFHRTLPEAAALYAVPWEWSERYGLRRYGFHGLSVAYAVRRATELLGALPSRLVVCHLGSGSSVTAVLDGRSVDTSMGFTPLEGVVMATRSGSVDPGLLLYLLRHEKLSAEDVGRGLEERSGLLGVSGVAADLRRVMERADHGDERSRLAYDLLIQSLRRTVGSAVAVLGGLDALVFTGGIGEHAPRVRADLAFALAFTGLGLDAARNERPVAPPDADVATPESAVRVLVLEAREDLTMLREMRRLLGGWG
ncbi:MAG TPA: acetate/propionate family kinase [Thermoanaerobaculia bacterium]